MSVSVESECIADIEEVADLYARHAVRVRRLVALDVSAPEAVIEDACQVAWLRLVRHRARVQRAAAVRWLIRVARREAYRQLGRNSRELSLDAILDSELEPTRAPDLLDELVACRIRLQSIRDLPDRQRRLVWLQGLGFSYAEIAGATGDSRRTVERQLLRARHALARSESAA